VKTTAKYLRQIHIVCARRFLSHCGTERQLLALSAKWPFLA